MHASTPGTIKPPTAAEKSAAVFSRSTAIDLLAIALVWGLAVMLVRPVGEFPLNDDWAMSLAVKHLVAGEGYHPGWTEMSLITHVLWGALFCLPDGFSFTALRGSTLALSLGGALTMYVLIRQLQRPRLLAVIGALALVFNPLFFALSNTFMTDVPFTTLALLSVLFFVRHLQRDGKADLLGATVFAIMATMSRQTGLFLPMAFGLTLWLRHGFQWRWMLRAALPALVCVLILVAYQHWLKVTGELPAVSTQKTRLLTILTKPLRIPLNVVYYGWSMLMYLGWFLLPVTLPMAWPRWRGKTSLPSCFPARIACMVFLGVSVVRFIFLPSLMPVHNNILAPEGIGPATLHDTLILHLPNLPALPAAFWLLVTVLSLGGAALLVFELTRIVVGLFPKGRFAPAGNDSLVGIFLLLCVAVYLAPFLVCGFFDRYLIPVAALLTAFLAGAAGREFRITLAQRLVATLLIVSSGIFAIAGTRDYLEWNRTRWKALHGLLAQAEVKPKDVDGGFEYNGWYLFEDYIRTNGWAINGTYVITFGEVKGYEIVRGYDYQNRLPPQERKIFVLKRQAGD